MHGYPNVKLLKSVTHNKIKQNVTDVSYELINLNYTQKHKIRCSVIIAVMRYVLQRMEALL